MLLRLGTSINISAAELAIVQVPAYLLFLRQELGHTLPDGAGSAFFGETEGGIGSPASLFFPMNDVGNGPVYIHRGHTFTKPVTLHLGGGNSPHLHIDKTRCGL